MKVILTVVFIVIGIFSNLAFATDPVTLRDKKGVAVTKDLGKYDPKHIERDIPMTVAKHSSLGGDKEQIILTDNFGTPTLGPEYEIHDGPGFFDIKGFQSPMGGFLRYYALPRGVEFAGETELNIDSLGRPYAPSLLIARPFRGETWTFDTKVTYGFKRPSNGRAISIWITFGDIAERSKNTVKITRYNDNPGNPKNPGTLGVSIFESSKQSISKSIALNEQDRYFFRIKRKGHKVAVLVSANGTDYSPVLEHDFGAEIDQKLQWIIINGTAFGPGAYADIEYLSVSAPTQKTVELSPILFPVLFQKHGLPNQRINVDAKEIIKALKEGKNINVKYATIKGILDLREVKVNEEKVVKNHITFNSCSIEERLSGGDIAFKGNMSFVNCDFGNIVNFSGTKFNGKVDFSSSNFSDDTRFILARFARGADFSGVTFKRKVFFRLARFEEQTSFYYSNFEEGADFSSVVFKKDVSFSDFSFSNPGAKSDLKPYMTFFGTIFNGKAMFISSLQQNVAQPLGEEISFQASDIKDLIFSSGDPDPFVITTEQTGKGLWAIKSNISLLDAKVESVTLKNTKFTGITDFRGVTLMGSKDSVRFLNVDFANLKLDSWPVGKVLATPETRLRLVGSFEVNNNTVDARKAFFDLLPVSKYYETWLKDKGSFDFSLDEFKDGLSVEKLCKAIDSDQYNLKLSLDPNTIDWLNELIKTNELYTQITQKKDFNALDNWTSKRIDQLKKNYDNSGEKNDLKELNRYLLEVFYPQETPKSLHKGGRPKSYQAYSGYLIWQSILMPFLIISDYGTSFQRMFLTGFVLTFLFAVLFLCVDKGQGHLIRIEKPMELKTRLAETPVLSFGEKVIQLEEVPNPVPVSSTGRIFAVIQSHLKSAQLSFLFSLNTVVKIGFGNIRVQMKKDSPKILVRLAWVAWIVGYGWYLLLIYTLSVIPVIKGLF